ncbi:MAG: AgmX/PglI C-terminal domain-containing protein, partial [Bdellovibrionales bacterium]|nr:AgmX/PglI C-terminal domain-containing protein [Bdellovibrionales bacterium]
APAKAAGGDAGEGAKAAGPEGRKGTPTAPPAKVAQQASRGTPSAPGSQKSLTQGKGNVESFFGDIQGTISQNLAAGAKGASLAADRLKGFGGQTTQGEGGLGQVGTGKGGGGTSLDVAGAGTKGVGEGAFGKGLGAIGSGGNIVGTGRGRPSIQVGNAAETIVMGGLDKDVIDRIIKEHIPQIRTCYEKEANLNPSLRGRIMTRFVITATGRVSQAGIEATSMRNANVERCLTGVIRRIQFPEPVGGTLVEVSYPFQFTPAGGAQ